MFWTKPEPATLSLPPIAVPKLNVPPPMRVTTVLLKLRPPGACRVLDMVRVEPVLMYQGAVAPCSLPVPFMVMFRPVLLTVIPAKESPADSTRLNVPCNEASPGEVPKV